MKKKLLNFFKVGFFLGLGIFLIWLFLHNLTANERKEILDSFTGANYWWIVASIFLALLSHISRTIRWSMLLETMGYEPRFKNSFLAVMIGYFANLALPRLGEVSRCGILTKYEKIPLQKSFGTVVTERAVDLLSLFIAFLITFALHLDKLKIFKRTKMYHKVVERYESIDNPIWFYVISFLILAVVIALLYFIGKKISHTNFYKKLKRIVLGFYEGIKSLMKIKRPFWFIFHSVFIWCMYLGMTWLVFFSLPETSHLGLDVALAVMVFGSVGIIIIQGGIGIYPWIVAEILALFAISQTTGYAMGWLLWTGQTLMIIIAGIVSMILLPILNRDTYEKS
ncbi:MAG: flippase-like domain-containing protein [Chlorobi bacterium]|nr:flippase-like domain-containing protein [Chlorobiota bacterium]